ncbi:apolipoprotein N-acyltransferase [Candidatus Sumerlaeota bacterium]|nr:apolipoprotein N-acyltransferase [Candidatus Sumerlaeota bacterium]
MKLKKGILKNIFLQKEEFSANRWRFLVIATCGVLLRFAFPKYDIWWLVWLVPVPFFLFLFEASPKRSFWFGWLFGFSFYYTTIFWLNTLTAYNPFVPAGILLMGIAMGLFVAAFALCNSFFETRIPQFRWFYTPALWVVFEYARSLGPFGFPWAYLAHTHYRQLPFIQIADITGVYGISFIIVTGNVLLAEVVHYLWQKKSGVRRIHFPVIGICFFCILIAITVIYGHFALKSYNTPGGNGIRIGIVQPNVPQRLKLASYLSPDESERLRLQLKMTKELAQLVRSLRGQADLILCPETAISDPFFSLNEPLKESIQRLSDKVESPILFGADNVYVSPGNQTIEKIYNSAWLVFPQIGFASEIYNKIHLVPFGEYVPLGQIIPFLQEGIVQVANFDAGTDSIIFKLKKPPVRFGVVICFESSFPHLFRRLAERGAQFFSVITNDAWYGRSSGAYQHFALSVFRAIEFRRPVLRSANTGISAVISATGKILRTLPLEEKGTITERIFPSSTKTFYQHFSDLFIFILALALALLYLFITMRKPKSQ